MPIGMSMYVLHGWGIGLADLSLGKILSATEHIPPLGSQCIDVKKENQGWLSVSLMAGKYYLSSSA